MKVSAHQPLLKGGQFEFVTCDSKHPALTGGYGSGKTHAFVSRTLREMAENKECMHERTPAVLMEPTHPMARDILLPELTHRLDIYEIPWSYNKSEHRLIVDGFGHLLILSAENYRRHVGLNIPFFGVDELDTIKADKARAMWGLMIGRLRVRGSTARGFASGTPEGYGFMWERWEDKADEYHRLHRSSSRDNPYLPDDYVPSLLRGYDEQLVKAYVDGHFVNLTGARAAYAFDREIHVRPLAQHSGEVWAGLDFNVGKMCCEIACEFSDDSIHYFDEIILRNSNTEEVAQELRHRFPQLVHVYPDPAGKARSTTSSRSDHRILEEYGFRVHARTAHPTHRDRLNSLNRKLKNAQGKIGMWVAPKCKELIADLEQVTRDRYGGIEKQDSERTHALDACSYAIEYRWSAARQAASMNKRF